MDYGFTQEDIATKHKTKSQTVRKWCNDYSAPDIGLLLEVRFPKTTKNTHKSTASTPCTTWWINLLYKESLGKKSLPTLEIW